MPACLPVCLSVCMLVCLSTYLPVSLLVCPYAFLPPLSSSLFLSFFFCLPIFSTFSTLLPITENYVTYFFSNKYEFILLFFALLPSSFLLFVWIKEEHNPNVPDHIRARVSTLLHYIPCSLFPGNFLLPSECKLKNVCTEEKKFKQNLSGDSK